MNTIPNMYVKCFETLTLQFYILLEKFKLELDRRVPPCWLALIMPEDARRMLENFHQQSDY